MNTPEIAQNPRVLTEAETEHVAGGMGMVEILVSSAIYPTTPPESR